MAETADMNRNTPDFRSGGSAGYLKTIHDEVTIPSPAVNGSPGPAVETNERSVETLASGPTPPSVTPRERSPDRLDSLSTASKTAGVLKRALPSSSQLAAARSNDLPTWTTELPESDSVVNGNGTPTVGRKSVQFSRDTQEIDAHIGGQDTPPGGRDEGSEQDKPQSLYARLRALALPQGFSHARSPSVLSLGARSTDGKELDGFLSSQSGRNESGLAATMEEDSGAEADADAEESATETGASQRRSRRHRRRFRHLDNVETAPSSPHSPMRAGSSSMPQSSEPDRPRLLARRATDTDMAHGGLSEDEGRKHLAGAGGWTPRHPLRGLSYGGQKKAGDTTPEGQRRPLTLLGFSNMNSSRDAGSSEVRTPKTPSRRKLMAERGSTLSAARWRQIKNSFRMLGQSKKKERTPDHEKSAELLAELSAATPAALILASMFQRDEHDHRRIPVLLEQLKLQITDSEVDKSKDPDSTQSDPHLVFRIELEYGNGINRMNWVVKRSLRDFVNLHLKYKLQYSSEKLLGRGDSSKQMPKFPKSAFPYLKSFRGFDEEEEDEEDEPVNDNDAGAATDTERPIEKIQHRSSFTPGRRKSSVAGLPDGGTPGGAARRDARFAERQRKKLEAYLQKMLKFLLFRPESNRVCKFLEVSALGMRLAAEGSYHGKEGFLLIRSAKGLDFRKAMTPRHFMHQHAPKWFLVRHSYVVCVDSPEEMHIYDVLLFDSDFDIQYTKHRQGEQRGAKELAEAARESAKHPQHHRLKLANSERRLKLLARNERQLHQFEESIRTMMQISPWVKKNRFDSFAPVRPNCFAQWLVDGRDHMWVLSRALEQAKDVIYIHDWWLSPELYMRRPPAISQKWRLDRLLKRKAEEGVKIFVIVYRNIESAIPIDSQYTKFSLLDLHPNVFVQRSPNQFRQNTFFWAHHEKLCIVDHTLAFVGGIDLCFGRWDTPQHTLVDDKPTGFETGDLPKDADHCQLWPGKDYSNPRVQDFYALNRPYEEMYDRKKVPRMPWHDISMQVVGQPARDLTRHFVQRWNYILRQRKPTRPTPFLLPPPDFNPADLEALGLDGTCEVQILRSAGPWSIGTPEKTEHSIMNAYVKLIEESEHFVYIENQFFISSCETEGATVHNKINDAIVERITRAAKNDEAWRAVILIPLIPGFQNTVEQEGGTSVRLIMQYQYRSICRGESSIFGRLKSVGIEPEDYIQFYSLRQWGRIGPTNTLVTEQLYIHAKCMVVDDRVAIIGSANINERSMLGNRDSECAAVVRDTDMVWSRMNGKPYQVGRFPHTLRMRLMREHLGLDVDQIMEDAHVMEAERNRSERAGKSPQPRSSDEASDENDDEWDAPDDRTRDIREDLLRRAEDLKSFNHDVDWEQADNPNLKSGRKLTEDARVTGNTQHKHDVEGQGFDKMADIEAAGLGNGRDTVLVRGNKEVLISDVDPEGHATLQHPRKRGEEKRLPSYVVSLEAPNPPLPPRPNMERMNTEQLGLPLVSQLPALPQLDDSDIGGPPLTKTPSKESTRGRHPLMSELKRPLVDQDCMTDPIHDAFLYDTWHAVAENNTKIYRSVFRCMPDNQVRNWDDYHQYVAYEQRFDQLQGNDTSIEEKVAQPTRSEAAAAKSGPPGAGTHAPVAQLTALTSVPADIQKGTGDAKDMVKDMFGAKSKEGQADSEKAKLRAWAAQANQEQAERQRKPSLHRQESLTEEKAGILAAEVDDYNAGLQSVPEGEVMDEKEGGGADVDHTNDEDAGEIGTELTTSTPSTATAVEKEKLAPPFVGGASPNVGASNATTPFVGYSDAINQNSAAATAAAAAQGAGTTTGTARRRRRATTRSGRRDFSASDDILSVDEAEELLNCIQGHLVVWPYDWLEKVEAGSNWLFPFDQISPIEI
ncbi:Phospholipase D1 [Exophiala dermatitidis]|uniref:Phospholipase D1 n=2 Tax=Exophiala dermatitidis TaxID=5970 RepID=H6C3T9_EXODN|nr:phospholipase D [Exophiala dermatitidis NIH/UT8656]KAJ4513996.1 Phospholipase D1 [Exophiala dermatitidis]EHY58304.1 phospholipase D [Exophiala dermatitidis NIH/UT8656]KAJ4517247.1 Phospholipase D1 [Exophiala dermatitidis]KAJ4519574.1 Phospholipase D1 [Exophiala dermatitidis]KAJ4534629.1 Phospholipase D1 [Exophiala dermatitidis]